MYRYAYYGISPGVKILMSICGIIAGLFIGRWTKSINEKRGYKGGFAWGFFLGLIGVLIVYNKPDISYKKVDSAPVYKTYSIGNNTPEQKTDERRKALDTVEQLRKAGVLSEEEYKEKVEILNLDIERYRKVESLNRLLEKGVIDKTTYEQKKAEIINISN